jgi:hypothetical protein
MKLVYIHCAGGVGAQILVALTIGYFKDCKIFIDGSYFGKDGSQLIPNGINYFDKVLSNDFLNISFLERNRFVCRVVRKITKYLARYFKNIIYIDDHNQLKLKFSSSLVNSDINGKISSILFSGLDSDRWVKNTAHVRRGDYIAAGLPLLGLDRLLEVLETERVPLSSMSVITDSPKDVLAEFERHNSTCNIINGDAISDLFTMTRSELFVASDSQFSLAAILLSNSMKTVFIPKRWSYLGISDSILERPNISKVVHI